MGAAGRTIAVMVELTPRAHDALLTSQTAARRFDPEAHIRLTADGATVRALLVLGPEPGDAVLDSDHLDPAAMGGDRRRG